MSVSRLVPANVRGWDGDVTIARLVGDRNAMWGDDSDATYGATSSTDYGLGAGLLFGDIGPVDGVTAATANVRAAIKAGTRASFGIVPLGNDTSLGWTLGYIAPAADGWTNFPALGVATDFLDLPLFDGDTGEPMTPDRLASLFRGGFTVEAQTNGNPQTLTVFEFTISVTIAGGPYRARQRLHPVSRARRWPRPGNIYDSPRRVGGYK